jgi:transcriptional regulator of acetoin/glycerol metabolism
MRPSAIVKDNPSTTLTTDFFPGATEVDDGGPGVVGVFSTNRPTYMAFPLTGEPIVIGRKTEVPVCLPLDSRISRTHASVRFDGKVLEVVDLDSHNGTFIDGARVKNMSTSTLPRTLRVGDTVFIFVKQVGPFISGAVEIEDGAVVGPTLAGVRKRLAQIASSGAGVLLTGATGVGKEVAARHYHTSSRHPSGPFIAVNCATIPTAIAERLLFGAQKGAYSGADTNVDGYVQASNGGTLFLDEIAELEATVQAKLLRVVETKEVLPLGATQTRKVNFQLCAATLKDLRGQVAAGHFREDLYHRIGRPEVRIPPLRDRLEEIPWLAAREIRRLDDRISPTASFIEACLLRDWNGNLREFLREMQEAAMSANADSRTVVVASDLSTLDVEDHITSEQPPSTHGAPVTREEIIAALRSEAGNVSGAARRLSMHRNQLRRWLNAQGLNANLFRSEAPRSQRAEAQMTPATGPDGDED